jgi:hypothetical protein
VGAPPGRISVRPAHNDIGAHHDREIRRLESLVNQGAGATGPGASSAGAQSTKGTTRVFERSTQSVAPNASRSLTSEAPVLDSVAALYSLNTPAGSRRPGSKPNVPAVTRKAPHHLIGDPPTWPDGLETLLYTEVYGSDERGLLSGEIRVYTDTLYSSGGEPANYWQTVFNWNPKTGMGRSVYWESAQSCWNDPSWVSYYYYPPASRTRRSRNPTRPRRPTLLTHTYTWTPVRRTEFLERSILRSRTWLPALQGSNPPRRKQLRQMRGLPAASKQPSSKATHRKTS